MAALGESGDDRSPPTILRDLVRYLVRHPESKDTIRGIQWWLPGSRPPRARHLQSALDEMVSRGWLVTRGGDPSTRIYGLDPRALPEMTSWLEQQEHFGNSGPTA